MPCNKLGTITKTKQVMNIKYRSVYLSDLKKIVDLYTQQDSFRINTLTPDFGLPLDIMMTDNDKMLACSFILFNDSDEITYRVLSDKTVVSDEMAADLLLFTQKDKKNRILRVDSQKIIVFLQNI